jgi:hypothetical protein
VRHQSLSAAETDFVDQHLAQYAHRILLQD